MQKITAIIIGLLLPILCLSQKTDGHSYHYSEMNIDFKKDYNNAKFVLNYYFTDGISHGDRYSYEIIVTDSLLTLMFNAPDFGSYNYLKYTKQLQLYPQELDTLKTIVRNAQLRQIHKGIADWQGSMYTREVLIVKLDNLVVSGGQTYGPIGNYADDEPEDQVLKAIAKDKKDSSSISGDYSSVVNFLKTYFTNIDDLYKQAYKY